MSETLERTHGGRRAGAGRPRKPPSVEAVVVIEPRWYVAATWPQAELWAQQSLARLGYDTYLPLVEGYRRDGSIASMKHVVCQPMWPGYLLIEMVQAVPTWRAILAEGNGLRGMLGQTPERPSPLPRGFVADLQALADAKRILRSQPGAVAWTEQEDLPAGAAVAISDGPFADHAGVCVWSDATRVKIAAEMFGGLHEITVARSHVRKT